MARGTEDYLNPLSVVAARGYDTAVLVFGTVGFVPIDNLGRWLWYDNFRYGQSGWHVITAGDADSPYLYSGSAFVPPYVMSLPSGTLGAGGGTQIDRVQVLSSLEKCGLEFACKDGGDDGRMQIYLDTRLDGQRVQSGVNINWDTGKILLLTSTGLVEVRTFDIAWNDYLWTPIKYVVDPITGYYVRLIIANKIYDVSDHQAVTGATGDPDTIFCTFTNIAYDATPREVYLGYCVMTEGEP